MSNGDGEKVPVFFFDVMEIAAGKQQKLICYYKDKIVVCKNTTNSSSELVS